MSIITEEIVWKASHAWAMQMLDISSDSAIRAALLAVLPDIERAVREECAVIAETTGFSQTDCGPPGPGKMISGITTFDNRNSPDHYNRIAAAIRALPPSAS